MSRTQRLCDLVDALIGPISCDESIETHNVRMAVRDVRDDMRIGSPEVVQGPAARDLWEQHERRHGTAPIAAKKGRAA